jgi:hypothetical protein
MIHHVIQLKLTESITDPDRTRVLAGLQRLADVAGVESASVGWVVRGGDWDVAALVALADEDAYRAYLFDPAHLEVDRIVRPWVTAATVLDLSDEVDDGLGDRLAALAETRERELASQLEAITTPKASAS